jgi:hypothetical protein
VRGRRGISVEDGKRGEASSRAGKEGRRKGGE